MKLLKEITDRTVGLGSDAEQLNTVYELRKSARVILLNEAGEMATQFLKTYNFHKLPGGGVDLGESVPDALHREVLEEVGCECEIIKPIGITIEYRNKYKLLHISYCYLAKVVGDIGDTKLEAEEIAEGQVTLWISPEEVLARLRKDTTTKYEGRFILEREKAFLEEYLR